MPEVLWSAVVLPPLFGNMGKVGPEEMILSTTGDLSCLLGFAASTSTPFLMRPLSLKRESIQYRRIGSTSDLKNLASDGLSNLIEVAMFYHRSTSFRISDLVFAPSAGNPSDRGRKCYSQCTSEVAWRGRNAAAASGRASILGLLCASKQSPTTETPPFGGEKAAAAPRCERSSGAPNSERSTPAMGRKWKSILVQYGSASSCERRLPTAIEARQRRLPPGHSASGARSAVPPEPPVQGPVARARRGWNRRAAQTVAGGRDEGGQGRDHRRD